MLEVRDLAVSYGKIRALHDVSLNVKQGEIVALLGANGAGKSSTMHAICGLVKTGQGTISFLNEPINGLPSHAIIRRGLVQVPEGRQLFANLTIEENLLLGAYANPQRNKTSQQMQKVLALFPVLKERLSAQGSDLSGGQAQMLALARGLMADPKLLMLDEPALGLAPIAMHEVFALIQRLRDAGTTILLVEQNVQQALTIADRAYVLDSGRITLSGAADEMLNDESLRRSYLGDWQ